LAHWIIRFEDNKEIKEHILSELPNTLTALRQVIDCYGPIEILYQDEEVSPIPIATFPANNILYRTDIPLPKRTDANSFFMHSDIGVSHIVDNFFVASQAGVDNLQMENTLILSVVDVSYKWEALKDWYDKKQIFKLLQHAEKSGKNIIIHCQHGCQRSPCILALYLIQSGRVQTYAEVVELIRRQRPSATYLVLFKKFLLDLRPLSAEEEPLHSEAELDDQKMQENIPSVHLSEKHKTRIDNLITDYSQNRSLLFSRRRKDKKEFLVELKKLPDLTEDSINALHRAHPYAYKGKKSRVEELVREIQSEFMPKKN
jgi:Dual specificity phosphatase, catalytic domain